jgi:hypothetical protein
VRRKRRDDALTRALGGVGQLHRRREGASRIGRLHRQHRCVTLDQRLARQLLVQRKAAPAIGCSPQEPSQAEALILQRMRDLVRQRRPLLGQRDEVGD